MSNRVVVVGASGLVGRTMLQVLDERKFPVDELVVLASSRSAGATMAFRDKAYTIQELSQYPFHNGEIVLSSAGGSVSKEFAPRAAKAGAVVIDNTSAFRMDTDVPLVVPEVNPHAIAKHHGIIANPNCSTIQMVVALAPLHRAFGGIRRIVVSTYQAVSGAGWKAVEELTEQSKAVLAGEPAKPALFPHQIAFNCIPQIGQKASCFVHEGYTDEEMKMVNETRKILEDDTIAVAATTVRVPVMAGHSESVYVELGQPVTAAQARQALEEAPGVIVQDDPTKMLYPLACHAAGRDETFVGRIRPDLSNPHALNLWVVSDNLRKGAATNAVQIAEFIISHR